MSTLDTLSARLPGRLARPGEPAYDQATTPRNATARQRPAAVVTAQHTGDVVEAVRAARDAGLKVAVQATGHGAAGVLADDVLMIDTSRLRAVEVDADRQVVRAQVGATFGQINEAAWAHGLLAPGGTAPDVAVAGYVSYGGVGWLTRPHGLASAALLSVEVVDGSGDVVTADDRRASDVLWAWRGGGGAGIATAVELRLFPAADLHAGFMLWPADAAADVIPAWGANLGRLDPALSSTIGILKNAPAAPGVPEALTGQPLIHLSAASIAGEEAMATLREVLRDAPAPAVDTFGSADAKRLSTIHLDPPVPVPARGEGRWLSTEAGVHALDMLTAAGVGDDSSLAEVELRHVATAGSEVDGAQTTCPGALVLHATGPASDQDAEHSVREGLDAVLVAAKPWDTGCGAPAFRDGQELTTDALPADTMARVTAIRRAMDPDGILQPSHLSAARP